MAESSDSGHNSSRGPLSRGGIAPQPLFAVGAVLLGSFLANFDSRLTSVGLPDLRGAFSLGFDEGAWLSTAAIGSQIFIAPAVAWLATVFGLRRILGSIGSGRPRDTSQVLTLPEGGGFLDLMPEPVPLPAWLPEADLAVMADAYRRTGFRGGLNYYRNLDRNWELLAAWQGALIQQPALFIAGTRDPVIAGPMGRNALDALPQTVPGLRRTVMLEGAGHWIQQERPDEVNAALIEFLAGLGQG